MPLEIPRDREGTFRPQLVPTGVRRRPQFDAHVLSLYARGITVRDMQAHLEQLYQVEVSPSVISAVTDEVMAGVTAWTATAIRTSWASGSSRPKGRAFGSA